MEEIPSESEERRILTPCSGGLGGLPLFLRANTPRTFLQGLPLCTPLSLLLGLDDDVLKEGLSLSAIVTPKIFPLYHFFLLFFPLFSHLPQRFPLNTPYTPLPL
jgi:hypothetical protein